MCDQKNKVCQLNAWEVTAWLEEKEAPDCANHKHISKLEAFEMTCLGDVTPYGQPIAKWVGPRHICLLTAFRWYTVDRWKFPRKQLLEQGKDF